MRRRFCLLTPPGRSAVATTWVRGENLAEQLSTRLVNRQSQPIHLKPLRPTFGYWKNSNHGEEGLVACLLNEDTAEIHSHGGSLAPQLIGDTLINDGFEQLTPDQWIAETCTVWIGGIRGTLIHAPTKKTAVRLLKLYQTSLASLAELAVQIRSDPSGAIAKIDQVLSFSEFGLHLSQPWHVVVCGQPNVGKSSLINAISGFDRTIVHDSPGTTRDVVSQGTAFDGWPILLTDTAGVRDATDKVEQQGVEKAILESETADLRIAVFDSSKAWSSADQSILDQIQPELIVHNKMDLQINDPERPKGIFVSATEKLGLNNLLEKVVSILIPDEPLETDWFPVNKLQCEVLRNVNERIKNGEIEDAASIIQRQISDQSA